MSQDHLPPNIATQLADLEHRHKRHQHMLDGHHEAKHDRRDAHRKKKPRRMSTRTLC
ncbi:hypothetical protein JIN84_17975 [Luteolibacter yonseiensis]|uniref:Uncharacterized protein n=1 Tax=Luteolibacter yonseiensis TaxID=1144680 RepID=A0A934R5U8_9BACT|nr:hypothetical protein [Luteolibacter yonseiensis]MBK1817514.1 hypothetical protein [Luteolibacter yonseiensis]